jgi:hypothetical protein
MLRLAFVFLAFVVAWSLWAPGRVDVVERDPERFADARGVPEPFETPRPGAGLGLDPGPHRDALERVESVLYRRGPADYGDAGAVESAALGLAQEVMEAGGLVARRGGMEIMAFASRVGAAHDVGYAMPDLVRMRRDWETVRDRVFRPASWMRTAAPDLDRIQDPPPPPVDPRSRDALADATRELERLMARAHRDVERLGEPRYSMDLPGRGDGGQIRAWHEWGERWRRELLAATEPVRSLSPEPHPSRQPLLFEARRSVEEAAGILRRIPDGAGMWPTPFRPAWEARFRSAAASLARARSLLAQVDDPPTRPAAPASPDGR